jgi:hypothetical protein
MSIVVASRNANKSHRMFPAGVWRSKARSPMANWTSIVVSQSGRLVRRRLSHCPHSGGTRWPTHPWLGPDRPYAWVLLVLSPNVAVIPLHAMERSKSLPCRRYVLTRILETSNDTQSVSGQSVSRAAEVIRDGIVSSRASRGGRMEHTHIANPATLQRIGVASIILRATRSADEQISRREHVVSALVSSPGLFGRLQLSLEAS